MSKIKLYNIGQLVSYNSITEKIETNENLEILIENNIIIEIGEALGKADSVINCNNMLVTPGFVDCHTHPVFYNTRVNEFSMRIAGATYEEIAKAGGGILSSVSGLRKATENQLVERLKKRMDRFLMLGTTTVECKSGYGLNTDSELKSLRVLDKVNKQHAIDIVPTFMGAHAFPNEYKENRNGYVDLICDEMIPEVAEQGIAIFNDVFCEKGYFNNQQTRRIIEAGKEYGLYPRMHADEFTESGSAILAGEIKSITADHLMEVSEDGMESLAKNNVIAILLPGTTFFLGKNKYAPYDKLKDRGIKIALASDYNPGSCNIQSMAFIIVLACIYMGMDIFEAIKATTYTSATSLMLEDTIGSIEEGKNADIIIWGINNVQQIPFLVNNHPIQMVLKSGRPVFTA